MEASIVIPVWNGISVLSECLSAIYACTGDELLEVIAVDNASADGSAALIADCYPQVHLIRQPVNLGFPGGVNSGVEAARGDFLVLLNQDCVVHPGWLSALAQALQSHPEAGIAGCTILNADGTVNHAGAIIRRPDAWGLHLTEIREEQPGIAEFVTGAAMVIRRQTWEAVGEFDEGYYPGYYEDVDYCYRARRRGIETIYVPAARVTHLFSGREWQNDPIKHTANHHRSRYRFVSKQFDSAEIQEFFRSEAAALEAETYFDQAAGRLLAARDTLRSLPDLLERRRVGWPDSVSPALQRQLLIGFTDILRRSFAIAERLSLVGLIEPPEEEWRFARERAEEERIALADQRSEASQELRALQDQERELFARLLPPSPKAGQSESRLRKWLWRWVLRPLRILTGYKLVSLSRLNALHRARMDCMERMLHLHQAEMTHLHQFYTTQMAQHDLRLEYHRVWTERRLRLFEVLTDYDYR